MYKTYLNRLKSRNISMYRHEEKLTSLINKKTIRYHLNKFIREYYILPEERTPSNIVKHAAKTLFWATVYLAFSCLTISSAFQLIQLNSDDEVTTSMKAIINNDITTLPNMTICFKMNAFELFNISSSSSFNYTSAWSGFFEETISHDGIFKVNESQVYADEIYLSLLKYLGMIYEAERAWEPGLTQMSTFQSEEKDDWTALKKVLMPNIKRFNITLEQLKSIFGGIFCSLPGGNPPLNHLLFLFSDVSDETECVVGNKISFIGMDTICFRLIGYKNYLRQLSTTEEIFLNLFHDHKGQKWCQELTIDLGSESRSTPRRATMKNETYAYYYNRFSCSVLIEMDIGIKALYRKLPYVKGDVQCSSDASREECENKCLRGWIRANCHCSPITFNLTTDTSSYRSCTVDDYAICLKKYTENATYSCTNKCVPICEQWHYEYGVTSSFTKNSFFVAINPRAINYVVIDQVFLWNSFSEFIGALGGALGIWLGLDFVIITEFIVKLVTRLIKKLFLRNVNISEEDKQRKSINIKPREENVANGISSANILDRRVIRHHKRYKDEIAGTSIRQINESEKQRTSRKKRESNALKEKNVDQRRKRSNNNRVDGAISDDKIKNVDASDRRRRDQRVNATDNIDAVQDESTAHPKNSNARSRFSQKMLLLLLNGDASTNKSVVFLRLVEKLSWVAIYLVGSVFTTLWCVELINLFLADETVYFPSLVVKRAVSLPPPSVCIFYHNNPFFEGRDNSYNALADYFNKSNRIDRASFIQISGAKAWPEPLVSIGLWYISILAASETNYHDVSFISDYELQLSNSAGEDTQLRNDINKSINDILLPKLLEWNVTANELRQKLGAELARMIKLKISFTRSNRTTDIVNETYFYTTVITEELFCYGLSYAVSFTDPDGVLEFSIDEVLHPQILSFRNGYIFFSDYLLEPKSEQFEIDDYSNVAIFDSASFALEYGRVKRTLISVLSLYTSRPEAKGVKYCSPSTTKSYCRAQCRIQLMEKLCNCSPTYWTAMIQPTSGLDECTFDRYMECLKFNGSDDLECKDSCLPFCTAEYYRSDSRRDISVKNTDTAAARFSVNAGIYVSIEEKQIITFINLLIKVLLDT